MLRAEIAQRWIREMAFHYIRRPCFPTVQKLTQVRHMLASAIAAQQFDRAWWRASAGIQQRNLYLAPRKCLIEDREIANNHCQNRKAAPGFYDCERPRWWGAWGHIPQPKGKQGGATQIQICPKSGNLFWRCYL